jgi:hypothetical protein
MFVVAEFVDGKGRDFPTRENTCAMYRRTKLHSKQLHVFYFFTKHGRSLQINRDAMDDIWSMTAKN